MKKIGICNNKGGVGKTTICFCLAGALAEMGKRVLLIDMDQQGSLSSSFLPNSHDLPVVITDALINRQISLKEAIVRTAFENIDIVPANLSLSKIESELLSDRDSHYYLADKLRAVESDYDFILVDSPPNLGFGDMVDPYRFRWGDHTFGSPRLQRQRHRICAWCYRAGKETRQSSAQHFGLFNQSLRWQETDRTGFQDHY